MALLGASALAATGGTAQAAMERLPSQSLGSIKGQAFWACNTLMADADPDFCATLDCYNFYDPDNYPGALSRKRYTEGHKKCGSSLNPLANCSDNKNWHCSTTYYYTATDCQGDTLSYYTYFTVWGCGC